MFWLCANPSQNTLWVVVCIRISLRASCEDLFIACFTEVQASPRGQQTKEIDVADFDVAQHVFNWSPLP